MKNLALIFLGWLCSTICLPAQTYSIRANTDARTTVEMTVRTENGKAYVHRAPVAFDANAAHGIQDLAGVAFGEGQLTIPDDGNLYWIVPFDEQLEAIHPPYLSLCFKCLCMETGECQILHRACYFGTCDACLLVLYPCIYSPPQHQPLVRGPFAIVKAGQVIME